MTIIEVRSAPHRKIDPRDIEPNPHRDLKANPIVPESVDNLIGSYERTGFWDNIVVREHPTKPGKYQLAYGHNRHAALKDKRVHVDTITIPVIPLTDWEMYCAMVDENELAGKITPAVAMENIGVGCDLIEGAFKKIGEKGTWEQFNKALGRVVAEATTRDEGNSFEQVRRAFFDGEGLGRRFVVEFLPCGKMREQTISTILGSRYGDSRAAAKAAKAKAKEVEAKEARAKGDHKKADKADAESKALASEAKKLGKGVVSKDVLLMFDAPRTMSDFAQAVKRLGIPKERHVAAAKHVIHSKVKEERIERELGSWWDEASGANKIRAAKAAQDREDEKLHRLIKGTSFRSFVLKIADDLKDTKARLKIALEYIHRADDPTRAIVEREIVPLTELLSALIKRSREAPDKTRTIGPAPKMLTHRKG